MKKDFLQWKVFLVIRKLLIVTALLLLYVCPSEAQRWMENLGRGTVAVRSNSNQVFVSWRILGPEFNKDISFNLYRGTTRIASNLQVSNFVDNTGSNSTYSVSAVINGVEQPRSPEVNVNTYVHGTNGMACVRVPINNVEGYSTGMIHVGDLNGDGEYDFVFTKQPYDASLPILLEAYLNDGTFLWQLNLGLNSVNKYNIEPGSSALDVGHGDNWTVYDLNSDGRAEVIVRTANGVIFPDGSTLNDNNNTRQFISVVDGMTGVEQGRAAVPTDYLSDGPMNGHMGIAYLDGENPSVVWSSKNRVGNGGFNMMVTTYNWEQSTFGLNWKWLRNGNIPDGHNINIIDVDGDGKDEICPMGFMLDDDGTLMYSLGDEGLYHGDRFYLSDMDPDRPGIEGWNIQQGYSPYGIMCAYYDARTGKIITDQREAGSTRDMARGIAGDFDPRYKGYEFHTFLDGLYNISGERTSNSIPSSYPNLRIWWDGDLLSENLDNNKMTKWNYLEEYEERLYTFRSNIQWSRNVPGFYGDIMGDWREEVVYPADNGNFLLVFTSLYPTTEALYTLTHNPGYRNCMTTKGYYQSNMVDYYLGHGMQPPVSPNIKIIGSNQTPDCNGTNGGSAYLDDCGVCVGGTTNKNPCADISDGFYSLQPLNSGLCMHPSAQLTQENCTEQADQVWQIIKSDNFYQIISAVSGSYVTANGNNEGDPVSLNSETHFVRIEDNQDGSYSFINSSNMDLAFDVLNFSENPGATLIQWSRHGGDNQKFSITPSAIREDCNGDFGGIASLDDCGRCIGGNTGKTNCTGSIQAEAACNFDGTIETSHTGYFGEGYVDLPYDINGSITFSIFADQSGEAILSFRYANGRENDRPGSLTLNGVNISEALSFEPTGSWATWGHTEINIQLQQGMNTLNLKGTIPEGLANIDELSFISSALSEGSCLVTKVISEINDDNFILSPNPASEVFVINLSEEKNVKVSDIQGRIIQDLGEVKNARFGKEYAAGVYLVHISSDSETNTIKVIKK